MDGGYGFDDGSHPGLIVSAKYAGPIGVNRIRFDDRAHLGGGLHGIHMGVEHDGGRVLVVGGPSADQVPNGILATYHAGRFKTWLDQCNNAMFVAPVTIDTEDFEKTFEEALGVKWDEFVVDGTGRSHE